MAQAAAEGATDAVIAVKFGFMTDEEAISQSVVEVNNHNLLDRLDKPVPGGLYDKALGPFDEREKSKCFTCGQRWFYCHGHFGHMKLCSPVYNPLLFHSLSKLLNKICLYCFQFQDRKSEVENCVSQLDMIMKGDVVGAKKLSSALGGKQGKNKSDGVSIDARDMDCNYGSHSDVDDEGERKETGWDTFELREAMAVIDDFLKRKVLKKKCTTCGCENPKITKPTFGWFVLSGFSGSTMRSNDVRLSKLGATTRSGSEVVNSGDSENMDDSLNLSSGPLLPTEVKVILRRCWQNEAPLCSYLCNILQRRCDLPGTKAGSDMFFLETIPVTPIKFRPPSILNDALTHHPHTASLSEVLLSTINLEKAHREKAEHATIIRLWMELQRSINVYFDSKTATSQSKKIPDGICQALEKKEGVFRQNMMGKRVNFACRSVISPDPYLGVNEIGVPPYFATRLTYPERVTPWNVEKMREAILNGPDVHPGAISYSDSSGTIRLPSDKENNGRRIRVALCRRLASSRGATTVSGKRNELDFESKTVLRHLRDGDVVLVNRQPTLHKPSIMAHIVRVLKGEKTLRMHYANCSSYNADFDGDEMNVHFPQDEISRAEAYNIVNANEQYIVPTRGDTVRGLIQDHIVGAVILTMKNTFLTRSEFSQLLYGTGVFAFEAMVTPVMPAIWKPKPLWTGKQVITALLNHITRGFTPCNVENLGKTPKNYFASSSYKNGEEEEEHNAEHKFLVWKNELVRGVIDKAQFGKFGLVHTVQELYGSNSAGVLLSGLSRLFTLFLQLHGFTCGLDDLIIAPQYDVQRKEKLEGDVGEEVHCEFVKFEPGTIGPEELQMEIEKAISSDRESATAMLDMKMKNKLTNKLTREGSQILKHLLTAGVLKPFPRNCISVMTTTGAKGSTVNFQQISAYLGQQELEGKRVPRMVSGKSLPSFPPWDYTSRSGGFISDRFLTGLRPQEYYFHCMAGREGLVDTAVKTSRSGYLQRCLIKNLEGLRVWNDCTVRDADCSIIQFYYGEDGVDAHKTGFLNNFKALEDNQETFSQKFKYGREFNCYIEKLPEGLEDEARCFLNTRGTEQVQKRKEKKNNKKFMKLVTQKYLSSLAEAGEPVGVIAAQSVGEPSTQMTLNTFHLAGRGEMNVTLGIPRLQEILMTASDAIKTPILTCPFAEWRSKDDVVSLVSKVKKVAVADLIESMGVKISFHPKSMVRFYNLTIKLKDTEFVSLENTHETLKSVYLRELEDAIENHLKFLKKITGIQNVRDSSISESSYESDTPVTEENGDDEDDDDIDMGEDMGSDVAKSKRQTNDDVDYESDNETEGGKSEETKGSDDELSTKGDNEESRECEGSGDEDENMKNEDTKDEVNMEIKSRNEKSKTVTERIDHPYTGKDNSRAVYLEIRGLSFDVQFKFSDEPHLLLAQVAMKAAKKIYIKNSGKISHCKMVQYDPDEKTIIWEEKLKPKMGSSLKTDEDAGYWAVRASGTDFRSFWELPGDLDLNRLYSNNVHAMLTTYGVEAARATLIREVKHVFDIYGVKIDYRHLSLIADFMTHCGGYRPMSRHGSIAESLSPFMKMSFETASKFIVEAASRGLTDNLETSSSRICLGLPAKVGTGSFDIMQKLEI